MPKLFKTKTFWTGVTAVVASAAGYLTGTIDVGEAIQTAIGGLGMIFLRSGIIKGSDSADG